MFKLLTKPKITETKTKITETIKVHLITFNTQGAPVDEGLNLENESKLFENIYKTRVDFFESFNTEKMIRLYPNFKNYLKVYPNAKGEHTRGCNIGYWAWKPFVIYHYLKNMKKGEILVYHDCNVSRYPEFKVDTENFKTNVLSLFNTPLDVIVPLENPADKTLQCKNYVKRDVFKKLGKENNYYMNFPILHANRIFIRKSKLSESFILNWLALCGTDLILPEINEPIKWHTHDQAILTVLYRKYMELGFFEERGLLYIKQNRFTKNNILIS